MHRVTRQAVLFAMAFIVSSALLKRAAVAARLENPVAVFAALDKVTARISKLEIPLNETVRFGALQITPRVCYTRPPTEKPKTTSFVEVREIMLNGEAKKLFSGWMFAESPGLNAVEHPVFDVWLTGCTDPNRVAQHSQATQDGVEEAAPANTRRELRRRRRRRVRR